MLIGSAFYAGNLSNTLQAGASALSLISAGKALLTPTPKPGVTPVGSPNSSFFGNIGLQYLGGTPVSFLFDVPQSEEVVLTSQITDHYVEANYAIQDHMAHEPVRITLVGNIAELVYKKSDIEKFLDMVLDRLSLLPWITPSNSLKVTQTLADANRLQSALAVAATSAKNAYNSVFGDGKPAKTLQQQAYGTLEGFWLNRQVLSVETPWNTFPSMLIESISFSQDETTKDMSTITLILKEFKTASTTKGLGQLKGRIASQASEVVSKGNTPGESVASSAATTIWNSFKAIAQ